MSLYQQYRPVTFADVVGQEEVVATLSQALADEKLAHALLLTGSHGTGKTTIARLLAAGICCEQGPGLPCGKCEACMQVQSGSHPDVWELDAASNRGVDDARRISERTMHSPMQAPAHILILDEAHMLTREAQNALLKTIEEPATPVHIILCTTEWNKILPTIRSRCQRYALLAPAETVIATAIERVAQQEGYTYDQAGLELIAAAADGSFRDGLSLTEQVMVRGTDLTEASVATALSLPPKTTITQLIDAWQTQDHQAIHELLHTGERTWNDWGYFVKQVAYDAAKILLNTGDARLVSLIQACDRSLQSALPYPLALEYNLYPVSSPPAQQAIPAPTKAAAAPRPAAPTIKAAVTEAKAPAADAEKAAAIGSWSAARISIMMPLIALAARESEPELYISLRTVKATIREGKLVLISSEYREPTGIHQWIHRWGKVDFEWQGPASKTADKSPVAATELVETVPDEALDDTLAELGILTIDED